MNIALRLKTTAEEHPDAKAVIATAGRDPMGRVAYSHVTFRQLDQESDLVARGLCDMGVTPGTRLVLMVRFGIEFVSPGRLAPSVVKQRKIDQKWRNSRR